MRHVRQYELRRLTKDDKQLIESAVVKYSQQIVKQMDRPGLNGYGRRVAGTWILSDVDGDSPVRACVAPMDSVMQYGDGRLRGNASDFSIDSLTSGDRYRSLFTRF